MDFDSYIPNLGPELPPPPRHFSGQQSSANNLNIKTESRNESPGGLTDPTLPCEPIKGLDSPPMKLPHCSGCAQPILDQFILRVAPDLEWHSTCLKCHQCHVQLDERQTCYLKDGRPYCKLDYLSLFSVRCGKCDQPFEKTDRVMRASTQVFHVDCFTCSACARRLLPGDQYAMRDDTILCKDDMPDLALEDKEQGTNNNNGTSNAALTLNTSSDLDNQDKLLYSPEEKSPGSKDSPRSDSKRSSKDGKPTRIRTVLNEKQLHTLRTCYNANPRPDALMREQLVEMTGLSPRVIRVWFQNKRCKDKKRSIAIKQMHQMQAEKNINGLNGVPMVAGSPMRHEINDSQFHYSYGLPPHSELDTSYMMNFENGGPGSVMSDGLCSPAGSDCSISLSSE